MSFHTLAAKAVIKLVNSHKLISAIDMGNQRITFDGHVINREIGKLFPGINEFRIENSDKISPSGSKFFSHLGFSRYESIDLNSRDGSRIMDLNENLAVKYKFKDKFDLVINNGTGEHIFDQAQLFKNLHNLTKVNGIILNIVPFTPWINHGFYNYNPVIFRDLAFANHYKWCFLWIGHADGYYKSFDPNGNVNLEKKKPYSFYKNKIAHLKSTPSELEKFSYKMIKRYGNLQIVAAYSKISGSDFTRPLQGKWLHNIERNETGKKMHKYLNQPDTFNEFHS